MTAPGAGPVPAWPPMMTTLLLPPLLPAMEAAAAFCAIAIPFSQLRRECSMACTTTAATMKTREAPRVPYPLLPRLEVVLPEVAGSLFRKPRDTPRVAAQATRVTTTSTLPAESRPTLVQGESKLVGPQQPQQPDWEGAQQPALPRVAMAAAALGLHRRTAVMKLARTLRARKKAVTPMMMRTAVEPVAIESRALQTDELSLSREPPLPVPAEQNCSHQSYALVVPPTLTGLPLAQ